MPTSDVCLVDTSVWLEVLPPNRRVASLRQQVDELLAVNGVAITGLVRLELMAGARNEAELARLTGLLEALPVLGVEERMWDEAGRLSYALRRVGIVVPNTDALLAAVAIAHDASLLHRDRHFDLIAAHTPLRVLRVLG